MALSGVRNSWRSRAVASASRVVAESTACAIRAESCVSSRPHPLEIGNEICVTLPPRVFDQKIEKADDRGDRRAEFLLEKGGDRAFEALAAHDGSPCAGSSASIFCSRRGNSTGFVS